MGMPSPPQHRCRIPASSWLNLVERWFAVLTERKIKRASHRSTRELERDIRDFLK